MDLLIEDLILERGGRQVLEVDRLHVPQRETMALLGPNGAGKSSLLRAIAGLDRPGRGRILFDGRPLSGRAAAAETAYAFQESVFLHRSVRANLELALQLRGVPRSERESRILEAATHTGTAPLLDRQANALSGGEARRVNLARALCLRSPITLLDEPLAGLDRAIRDQLLYEMPTMLAAFETTTLVVTHDRHEALHLASHLALVIDGRLRAAGPTPAVFREPPDPDAARLLGYTVVPGDGGQVGIPPGSLSQGDGPHRFTCEVVRVIDAGHLYEIAATLAGVPMSYLLPAGASPPVPGDSVRLSAPTVVRFPGAGGF